MDKNVPENISKIVQSVFLSSSKRFLRLSNCSNDIFRNEYIFPSIYGV